MQIDGNLVASIAIGVGGGVLGLVGKIVFDWLKNVRGGNGNGNSAKLAEALNNISHALEEIRKDTYSTNDNVKELKTKYETESRDFRELVRQSFTINTKMVVLLEDVTRRLEKIM